MFNKVIQGMQCGIDILRAVKFSALNLAKNVVNKR